MNQEFQGQIGQSKWNQDLGDDAGGKGAVCMIRMFDKFILTKYLCFYMHYILSFSWNNVCKKDCIDKNNFKTTDLV